MIRCQEAQKRWHLRHNDGDADPELDEHVASCKACRRYGRDMNRIVEVLAELRADTEQVTARQDKAPAVEASQLVIPSRLAVFSKLVRVAAMLAIVVAGGLYLSEWIPRASVPSKPGSVAGAAAARETPAVTIRLEGESAGKYLVVGRPTVDDNIQMIWLYPTLPTGQEDDRR